MIPPDAHCLSITALLAAFRGRAFSPGDYLGHLLRRIDEHDGTIHSMITLDADRARQAALEAGSVFATGGEPRPLEGVPIAIKDVIDVAGLPTTCHSRLRLGHKAGEDAAAVAALREAGAIIIGKTSTHEFAIGGPAFDLPFPPARNPWNIDHHPGGSSSGSGAGVAAGLFPGAIGTDTGGSVRHPASACAIAGLKPTYDVISRQGIFPLAFSLDHAGSLARTVEDAALLCDVMARGRTQARRDLGKPLHGLKVGYVRHFHTHDMIAARDVAAALDHAAERLREAGAAVQDITLPDLRSFTACNRIILQAEAMSVHAGWLKERPEDYSALTRKGIWPGLFLSADDLLQAQRRRRQLIEAVEAALQDTDVLLTASSMDVACRIDDPAEIARTYGRQARTPFNVTGHPAIAIGAGLSAEGLPLSLQIAGRYYDEAAVCRAASAIELELACPLAAGQDPRV